jgi:hypothetical protein
MRRNKRFVLCTRFIPEGVIERMGGKDYLVIKRRTSKIPYYGYDDLHPTMKMFTPKTIYEYTLEEIK